MPPSDAPTPFVLVDGSSFLFRAYHALPALTNSHGEPTGVILGVGNMLKRLLRDHEPSHGAVVFDAKGKTFRDDWYAAYKAQRPPMPEELAAQFEPTKALVEAIGLPRLEIPGVEADDVIATLARQAANAGWRVLIATGDKDMAQLVSEAITVVDTMFNKTYDRAGVLEKFGVSPEAIIDYLALVGDTSDNIPGVPKVGPKTAAKWLERYGDLKGILEHAETIRGKVGENLRAHRDQVVLNQRLVTVRDDIPLEVTPPDLVRGPWDWASLGPLLDRYEITSWQDDRPVAEPAADDTHNAGTDHFPAVLDWARFESWLDALAGTDCFAFDTETTSLAYMSARIVGVSFALDGEMAAYVPLGHADPETPSQLDRDAVLQRLRPLLEDPAKGKLGHNLKYDAHVLHNHGIALDGIRHDTMLESYVLDSNRNRQDLDTLAQTFLGYQTIHYETVAGKGAAQKPFDQVPVADATPYAAEDAAIAWRLHETLWPRVQALPRVASLYHELEIPLVPILARIEHHGVYIDAQRLRDQSVELATQMKALEAQAHELAGKPFNLGSPKQIQTLLFEEMGLPVLRKTPKGQPSTAEDVLQELALDYPLPRIIMDHRGLSKLKSTYTDKLPELVHPDTGRLHTSYHQAGTATGRLSSSDPNLQNIPVRTEAGRRIREAFVAPPGYVLLAADYSQIELRIMAHLSEDDGLLNAFANGEDIHRRTAAELFGLGPEAVQGEQRRAAKTINFGLIYGMSPFGLAKQLGIDRNEAQAYVDRYFARYPGVKRFMDTARETARNHGYVETVRGRRLLIPEIHARTHQRRQYAERTAINAPMQGTAADIIKRAMIDVDERLRREFPEAHIVMQVHDELVLEVPEGQASEVAAMARAVMAGAAALRVPLEVEVGQGANWDEAH
jgi:DNA polymerase-1